MDDSWHVVLRDIMIILAGGALFMTSVFTAMVGWQLYKLALELRAESESIVDVVRQTAETVQNTAELMAERTVPPAIAATGFGVGAARVMRELSRFYRGLRGTDATTARLRD